MRETEHTERQNLFFKPATMDSGLTRKKQVLSIKREEMNLRRKKPQERTRKKVLY